MRDYVILNACERAHYSTLHRQAAFESFDKRSLQLTAASPPFVLLSTTYLALDQSSLSQAA